MRFAKLMVITLTLVLTFACATVAQAVDVSTESTTSVSALIKLSAKTSLLVPAGSTQQDVALQLSAVNVTVPPMWAFGITFKGKVFAATPSAVAAASPVMVAAMKSAVRLPEFATIVFNAAYAATDSEPINLAPQLVRLAKTQTAAQESIATNIVAPLRNVARIAPVPIQYMYDTRLKRLVIQYAKVGYAPFSIDIEMHLYLLMQRPV